MSILEISQNRINANSVTRYYTSIIIIDQSKSLKLMLPPSGILFFYSLGKTRQKESLSRKEIPM